ncbi:hypothetical protein ACEWY4_002267 [Coilia grayii]|uniref:Uncharacterized protein n=1 Tax=Coilia grayii TaxID=363190 RepID=A0ABD1KVB6_9TELE
MVLCRFGARALEASVRKPRSASCPNGYSLGLPSLPRPLSDLRLLPLQPLNSSSSCSPSALPLPFSSQGGPRGWRRLAQVRPGRALVAGSGGALKRWTGEGLEEGAELEEGAGLDRLREAELHLYSVSLTSHIYLHLQSSWHSYIIQTAHLFHQLHGELLQEELSMESLYLLLLNTPIWEQTAHLFHQLHGELLQEELSMESLYLLLQELHTAAHRSVTIKKLFWRSSDLCPFLVRTLAHTLHVGDAGVHTADRLLLCTLVAQTLSLMFREMEVEPALLSMLTANQGALTASLLLALVCQPDWQPAEQGSEPADTEHGANTHTQPQLLQAEYLDAAAALLFEVIASRTPSLEHFLTVGWVLRTLKAQACTMHFVGYQAHQVVLVLSGSQTPLSPSQAVLLYQRCVVLLACLRYSSTLGEFIRSETREEFRYYVKASEFVEKLPPHYPISQAAQRLLLRLLSLVLHQP